MDATVQRLVTEQPDLMPNYPAAKAVKRGIDLSYGKKQITASVTSGILQGKSIKRISDDLQSRIANMNRTSAVRAARTAVTGAQNAGRLDSYLSAEKMGIGLKKEWLATLDGRTRHSHAMLDGEQVAADKLFSNGCRFPGDPQGAPSEIYNCRCTLIAAVKDVDTSDAQRRARDPETGQNVLIKNMDYRGWEDWKKSESLKESPWRDIINIQTSDGRTVAAIKPHFIEQTGTRTVSPEDAKDALINPLHITDVKYNGRNEPSIQYIGKDATVAYNPDTDTAITAWKTGKAKRKKYGGTS